MKHQFVGELTSIVDDLADDTSDVSVSLGVVEVAELGGSLVQARVGRCSDGQQSRYWISIGVVFSISGGTD